MRYGTIDIGTNTVLLLVADLVDGQLVDLVDTSIITRLGEGVQSSGRLSPAAMERTVAALQHYRRILDAYGVEMPDCYGTSAMREAGKAAVKYRRAGDDGARRGLLHISLGQKRRGH